MNIVAGLKILGDFKWLSETLGCTEEGANRRWDLLQEWLADHPRYRIRIYHCLSLTPVEAIPFLCRELDLDYDSLRLLDHTGAMLALAQNTIAQIQKLYRERSEADKQALLKRKKRKGLND